MAALVTACIVWSWMHWSPYALGTRTLLRFGHGCTRMLSEHECLWFGHRCTGNRMLSKHVRSRKTNALWFGHGCIGHGMLSKHQRDKGWSMAALVTACLAWPWTRWSPYALGTRTLLWCGHGCTGNRMLSKHACYYGLGMDALVTVRSRNTNIIMVWDYNALVTARFTNTMLWARTRTRTLW